MEPEEGMVLYNVACIFSLAGRLEDAIDCLEKSTGAGLVFLDWIRHDSNLDPLRDNLRFQKLMERLEEIQVPCS
jgi:adenylate cyclase